jgi:hypothetical protein
MPVQAFIFGIMVGTYRKLHRPSGRLDMLQFMITINTYKRIDMVYVHQTAIELSIVEHNPVTLDKYSMSKLMAKIEYLRSDGFRCCACKRFSLTDRNVVGSKCNAIFTRRRRSSNSIASSPLTLIKSPLMCCHANDCGGLHKSMTLMMHVTPYMNTVIISTLIMKRILCSYLTHFAGKINEPSTVSIYN